MFQNIAKKISQSRKLQGYLLLSIPAFIMIFQIWGLAIIGADDTYIATDHFRHKSFWNSTWGEAVHQGRYFLIIAWSMSQLAYVFDNFDFLNIIRITLNVGVFYTFFKFAKELFGQHFSFLLAIVSFGLFNAFGGEFNSYHGTPLWYSLGNFLFILSIYQFAKEIKLKKKHYIKPFVYYFLAIQFYEVMLFFAAAFPVIYLHLFPKQKNHRLKDYIIQGIKDHKFLIIAVITYLSLYVVFRIFFPSNYEGSKSFNFVSIQRAWRTIYQFSLSGIYFGSLKIGSNSFLITALISAITLSALTIKSLGSTVRFKLVNKRNFLKFLTYSLIILFFVFCPNFLYGFIDKYHTWSDALPYYNGSYLSSFPLLFFITFVIYHLWIFTSHTKLKHISKSIIVFFVFWGTLSNLSNSLTILDYHKSKANRWPLMDSFFQENILNIKDGDNFCSHKFYYKTDSFGLYNYWSLYLTNKYKKKVHFAYSKNIPKDCKWYIDIIFHKYSTEMIVKDLNTLKEFRYFESQTSIFKNF